MRFTFYGKIREGKLILDNRSLFEEAISCTKDTDVDLTLKTSGKDVNLEAWGYLYGSVYKEFANHFGWSVSDVDSYFKKKFMLEKGIRLPKGIILTKQCFEREGLALYVDSCIRYCADEGVVVPPANRSWKQAEERGKDK